jgi:hypothetical protein
MTPKSEALAFRIWAFCEPRGWDVSTDEIARGIGTYRGIVGRVLHAKGWAGRVRANAPKHHAKMDCTVERLDFVGAELMAVKKELSGMTADY